MFKLKKNKYDDINVEKVEGFLDKLPNKEIMNLIKKYYPIGCIVDQTVAYNGRGSKNAEISDSYVTITGREEGCLRIHLGNYGVWSSEYRKLAKKC